MGPMCSKPKEGDVVPGSDANISVVRNSKRMSGLPNSDPNETGVMEESIRYSKGVEQWV